MLKERSRDLRVADFVRDELSKIMQQDMRDPRVGMVSINDVKVSRDLAFADVYVSAIDTNDAEQQGELVGVLNKASGYFRSALAKRHSMRTTPKPRFHYDEVADRAPRLDALISKAVAADDARRPTGSEASASLDVEPGSAHGAEAGGTEAGGESG